MIYINCKSAYNVVRWVFIVREGDHMIYTLIIEFDLGIKKTRLFKVKLF